MHSPKLRPIIDALTSIGLYLGDDIRTPKQLAQRVTIAALNFDAGQRNRDRRKRRPVRLSQPWDESQHPRGQPQNKGEFAPKGAPHLPSLERAVVQKRLHSGVSLRTDANGAKWVVKERVGKGKQAANEATAANLAPIAGADVVPVHHVKLNGQDHVVAPHLDATDLTRIPADERRAALGKVPKEQLDTHALFDYAIGASDPNLGNYMLSADGARLHAIDKEQSLGMGKGHSTTFAVPQFLAHAVGSGQAAVDHQFDRAAVARMAKAAGQMAERLDRQRRRHDAEGVRRRAEVLGELASGTAPPTAGELVRLGAEFDRAHPPSGAIREFFGKLFGRKKQ